MRSPERDMKKFRCLALGVLFVFLFAAVAWGQTANDHFAKAQEAYKAGDLDLAITEFQTTVDLLVQDGALANAHKIQGNVGILYFQQEKYAEAADAFEKALSLDPAIDADSKIKYTRNLANSLQQLGRYATSCQVLNSLLAEGLAFDDQLLADTYSLLADGYKKNEIYTRAVEFYSKALELNKKLGNAEKELLNLNNLGLCYGNLGDFPSAIASLEAALPLAEQAGNALSLAEANSNLGIIHWDKGDYPKALALITKAKEIEQGNDLKRNLGVDYNNEGLVFKSAGNYPKGLESIEQAIAIAREVGNVRDEAIALSNRALINRILGQFDPAMEDYQKALELYRTTTFSEGMASCYLGLGKLYEVRDNDFKKAFEQYTQALDIYKELGNLGYQAEALNQIGRVLKKSINPARTTRDLMYEEEEPAFAMDPATAGPESVKAYTEALELGELTGRREVVWSALQGLGFALKEQGDYAGAFENYKKAVDIVINIRGGGDSELMADYLGDKTDLFTEAMEVCSKLYEQTGDKEYLRLQMEYLEIYKNEVQRNVIKQANLEFKDPEKKEMADTLNGLIARKHKVDQLIGQYMSALAQPTDTLSEAEKKDAEARQAQAKEELASAKAESEKLESSFKEFLDKWKQKYPGDVGMFDSAAKVDSNKIQSLLGPNEALIQYFPLSELLNIIVITKEDIITASVPTDSAMLADLIRDKFIFKNIEEYGHMTTELSEPESYKNVNDVLHELYQYLIQPIEPAIADKDRLIVVPSKFLSYVPFPALVREFDSSGEPVFMIYDKTISTVRLSFFEALYKKSPKSLAQLKVLAVGNPTHKYLQAALGDLPAAEKEVAGVVQFAQDNNLPQPKVMIKEAATETAWKEAILSDTYQVLYFATHGVPFAEIYFDTKKFKKRVPQFKEKAEEFKAANEPDKAAKYEGIIEFVDFSEQVFTSKSPLYGFLYMAYTGAEGDDGVLTLKEIMELPDSAFKEAKVAVLSACNTAVTYSPKITAKEQQELEDESIREDLVKAGWTPGVDQVSLSDTFMKRNFASVMGTLWFADDAATGYIMGRFFQHLNENDPAEALRQAQLDYLENPPMGPDYTQVPKHPYYWAVGTIFGK